MKYVKSEKGYTLALTLVLVIIIFMFTASFTVASMNQTKQVVKTDQSFVEVSVAEMGIEYLSLLYPERYNYHKGEFEKDVTNNLNNASYNYSNKQDEFKRIFFNDLIDKIKLNDNTSKYQISIFNNSTDAYQLISNNDGTTYNLSDYNKNNRIQFQSHQKDSNKSKVLTITFLLPSDFDFQLNITNTITPIPINEIKDKLKVEYCGFDNSTCYDSRTTKGNGNDSDLPSTYLSKDKIEIGMIKEYHSNPGTLFAPTSITIVSNQSDIGGFKMITDTLALPHSSNSSGKLNFKNTTIIVRELKFGDTIKDKRDITMEGSTKICFLQEPSEIILSKIKWPDDKPNYFILKEGDKLVDFFSNCGLSEEEFSKVENVKTLTPTEAKKLLIDIKY